jgi:hypothetical protein
MGDSRRCRVFAAFSYYAPPCGRQRTSCSTQGDSVRWARPRPLTGIAMPFKRGCEAAEDETAQEPRRTKSAVNVAKAMNEFLCPITFLLFSGDKEEWKLKLKEEEEVADTRRKAEAGQGWAMCNLGVWYKLGQKGLAKDFAKAFEWYKKSDEAGDAVGTGGLGRCYLWGYGVPKCPMRANTLMCQAAERGSKLACYHLGRAYAEGIWGFPKDETMARRYYSMVASASIEDCTAGAKEGAATWLREHPTT